MAYVAGDFDMEHVLIQWGGTLPGGETWSCSMRTGANTADPISADVPSEDSVSAWLAGSIKDAVLGLHTRPGSKINPACKLTYVKANRITKSGHYKDPTTHEYAFATIAGGGAADPLLPNQCTMVVSLTTGYKRGPAHRGRFYLPSPALAVDATTGAVSPYDAGAIATSAGLFVTAIADVPGVDAPFSQTPTVFSRKAGAAGHRMITGVEVGTVVDTQRRRRKSVKEAYQVNPLDLGAF